MGKHFFFLVFEVFFHFLLVLIIEVAEHVAIFRSARDDDMLQMLFDVRKTLVKVITVRCQ